MRQVPLFKVRMSEAAPALVGQVLMSGYIGQGKRVDDFEVALKARLHHPWLVTLNSATSGLTLALRLILDASPGDGEVLTQPITCTATNWPVLAMGLRLRWVDTDPT